MMEMNDAFDIWTTGVNGRMKHVSSLVDSEVRAAAVQNPAIQVHFD